MEALAVYDPDTRQFVRPETTTLLDEIVEDGSFRPLLYPLAVLLCLITIIVLLVLLFVWSVFALRELKKDDGGGGLSDVFIVGQNDTLNTTIVGPLGNELPVDQCVCMTVPEGQPPIPVFVEDDTLNTTIVGPLGNELPVDQCACVTVSEDQPPIPVSIQDVGQINVTVVVEPVALINATIESPLGNNRTVDECVCVTIPPDQDPLRVIVESPIGTNTSDNSVSVTFASDQQPIPVVFDSSAFNFTVVVAPVEAVVITEPIGTNTSDNSVSVTIASDQEPIPVELTDGLLEPFGRLKVSTPSAIFDNKLLSLAAETTNWDCQEVSGSGTTYVYSKRRASVTIGVTGATAGRRIRQSIRYMNYQPGRSQAIFMTLVPGASGTGILKRWGYFDQGDGLFFQLLDGVFSVVLRSNITGTPTDTVVPQSSFEEPVPTGWSLSNVAIYGVDFQWLGAGDARFFIMKNETFHYIHTFRGGLVPNAYMSSPNLPVRFEVQNDGTGAVAALECICTTVYSESGNANQGIEFSANRGSSILTLNTDGLDHSAVAIRIAPGERHTHAGVVGITAVSPSGNTFYIWKLYYRPVVAGAALTWTSLGGSNIQVAIPVAANTLSGGIVTSSGYISATNQAIPISASSPQTLFLGTLIDGTPIEFHLSVQRLDSTGGSSDFLASISYMEA